VLDLAGEKASAVKLPDEPELDESWAEPVAFDGCSTARAGQARHTCRSRSASSSGPVQALQRPALEPQA
jgi:nitrate reductase delta subunit